MVISWSASVASAQPSQRVLLLWEGAPDAAANARIRAHLRRNPGVASVTVAGAPLGDILLAAGCEELAACAPQIARAARADLLVVRSPSDDGALRVLDPDRPEHARTVHHPRDIVPSRASPNGGSLRPLTWALGSASLALFAGAAISGGLSLATQDEYARLGMEDGDPFERYALLARGQGETTAAWVLLGVGIATTVTTIVMVAFDLSEPPGTSLAFVPAEGGGRAEARWWF